MSYLFSSEPLRVTLGRKTWSDVHERASSVQTWDNAYEFSLYMRDLIENYKCKLCADNFVRSGELNHLQLLITKGMENDDISPRVAVVLWASRVHAMVTLQIIQSGNGYASSRSKLYVDLWRDFSEPATQLVSTPKRFAFFKERVGELGVTIPGLSIR